MILEYNDKIFQVTFVKIRHTATRGKKKIELIDTQCFIIMKDKLSDLWSEAQRICGGESKQYINDKYSKVLGKKYALLKALDALLWIDEAKQFYSKAFRTAIWKKFNETFGVWK